MPDSTVRRRVGVIVGSLAAHSINRTLARALIRLAPPGLEFVDIEIGELPLHSRDLDLDMPAAAQGFKRAIAEVDALLIVTPEHNRSIPGPLKNAIDWGSRPRGDSAFTGVPTAVIGASIGAVGTAVAQQHLKGVLNFLDAPVMNASEGYIHFSPDVFGDDGVVTVPATAEFLRAFMAHFDAFIASMPNRPAKEQA